MFRLLIFMATIAVAAACTAAHPKGHQCPNCGHNGHLVQQRTHGYRSQYRGPAYGHYPGYGYPGFGLIDPYAYDPYKYGRFRMQDPTDDPYLREKYRYDTFFPGRKHRRRLFRF